MRTPAAASVAAVVSLLVAAPLTAVRTPPEAVTKLPADPPNVVLLLVDDATVADIESMPNVQSLIVDRGASFTSNYSPDPLCCPARATLLTGRYPHNHGVLDNVAPLGGFTKFDDTRTVATYLTDDYRTGLFGKYLNDNDQFEYVPPGWDTFKAPVGRSTYQYLSQRMNVNGELVEFPGEQGTIVYSKQARAFIANAHDANKPFFAYVSYVAPHRGGPHTDYPDDVESPWVAPEYRYTHPRVLPADPSIGEVDVSDKPVAVQGRRQLTAADLAFIAERNAQRVESLRSVDAGVASIVKRLKALGELDNTYLVLASDNGHMQGQHRIRKGKSQAYEPAAAVPLIIRGPGIAHGVAYDGVTGLQDFTPTVLAMTGQTDDQPTDRLDGLSLLSLLDGTRTTGRVQLIEIAETSGLTDLQVDAGVNVSPEAAARLRTLAWKYRGIVSGDGWKYVELPPTGEAELYDLTLDPFEETNLAGDPAFADRVTQMSARLHAVQNCAGRGCR